MKPTITKTGFLNEVITDKVINSMPEESLAAPQKIKFTDLYLGDAQADKLLVSSTKMNVVRSDNEPFRNILFQISVLSYRGFFKDFNLCVSYRNANCSITEKFYPIDERLQVHASIPLEDILDLTQVCLSVRSKAGIPLKISLGAYGSEPAEEIKFDLTSIKEVYLYINEQNTEGNETPLPIGWISYNTQNIFF